MRVGFVVSMSGIGINMKFFVEAAGGAEGKTSEIDIPQPYEFVLNVGDKRYRFGFDKDGNIEILLINGVDAKITSRMNYPAIKLTHR